MALFVTVGTTEFDELIRILDTEEFMEAVKLCGCKEVVIQYGRGQREPNYINHECSKHGIKFSSYRFKSSLEDDMSRASLIVSHCGAGSILEAVTKQKRLIVVINDSLQDNHQVELADAVNQSGYALSVSPESVIDAIRSQLSIVGFSEQTREISFPINDPTALPTLLRDMYDLKDRDI